MRLVTHLDRIQLEGSRQLVMPERFDISLFNYHNLLTRYRSFYYSKGLFLITRSERGSVLGTGRDDPPKGLPALLAAATYLGPTENFADQKRVV